MTENTENLVLEHLRAIRSDTADLKNRITNIELQITAMGQQLAGLTTAVYAIHGNRIDRIESQLDRINRRLELQD